MKKLLIAAIIFLTTACSSHHSFMEKAVVGVVDNQKVVVMFYDHTKDGMEYYRPQFASDCPYNKAYAATDSTSTTCFIRETRITQMEGYYHHIDSGKVLTPRKDNSINHEFLDGVSNSDNITYDI